MQFGPAEFEVLLEHPGEKVQETAGNKDQEALGRRRGGKLTRVSSSTEV